MGARSSPPGPSDPQAPALRVELDPERMEQGFARLVLALMNALLDLMARQTARRIESGTVTPEEAARMTLALSRLDQQVADLAAHFGLERDDLTLDLGPLGPLR